MDKEQGAVVAGCATNHRARLLILGMSFTIHAVVCSGAAIGAPQSDAPIDTIDDYLGYWSFDAIDGRSLLDASENALDGVVYGARQRQGVSGMCLDFDGIDDYVEITDGDNFPDAIGNLAVGTISLWFKFYSIPPAGTIYPILYSGSMIGGANLIVELGHPSAGPKLYFTIYRSGLPDQCFDTGFELGTNIWYHFAAVVGADFNTGYLNGDEMTDRRYNFGNASSSFFLASIDDREVFWLGKGFFTYDPPIYRFHGAIDELRIYDWPLNADEVKAYYDSVMGLPNVQCELDPATAADVDGDGVPDECCRASAPARPVSAVAANRYLTFMSPNEGLSEAIRVKMTKLPAPFDSLNGQTMWVGRAVDVSERSGRNDYTPPTTKIATLRCEPYFANWHVLGPVHVYHPAIVPSGVYQIQTILKGCGMDTEFNLSEPLTLSTSPWCDVAGSFADGAWSGSDGSVDITTDLTAVVRAFQGAAGAPGKQRADVYPASPDRIVNVADISMVLDAFRGTPYPFSAVPALCEK